MTSFKIEGNIEKKSLHFLKNKVIDFMSGFKIK